MNMNFAEMYCKALIVVKVCYYGISYKVLNQLGMLQSNQSASASFNIELLREQNYNTGDFLSYVYSNIPKPALEQKCIYDLKML